MSIQIKKYKDEWLGYIFIDKIPIYAEIGEFNHIFARIKDRYEQMSKRM